MRLLATLLACLLVLSTAAPVLAQEDEGFLADFEDDDDESIFSTVLDYVSGIVDRAVYGATSLGDEKSADDDAEAVQEYFNKNSADFVAYANNRTTPSADYDVFEITFTQGDDEETIFLVATYNNTSGTYETAQMIDETNRTVDETVTLEGYASANASEELEFFHETFVEEGDAVETKYARQLAGRYGGLVGGSLVEEMK